MPITSKKRLFASDTEHVLMVANEAERAWNADREDRVRSVRNWEQYFALDGTQWPWQAKQRLNEQNRHAAQYNIIGPKVDALTGSLVQEEVELDWMPMEGPRTTLTEGLKNSWYADSELCDYPKHVEAVTRDGLIQLGVLKMYMNEEHNPLRNIAFKRMEPGFVFFDPYWISDDDNDCMKAWEFFHITAEEIAERFGISTPEIEQQIKFDRKYGGDYKDAYVDNTYYTNDLSEYGRSANNPNYLFDVEKKGHLYKVIEYHWIDKINTTRLIGQKLDSEMWMPFPITTERKKLEDFMIKNQIDPLNLIESPYTDKIHRVTTVCYDLAPDKILEDGVSVVQPKRLPYFQFCGNRAFGKNKGVVDDMFDIQQTINKRESKLTDLIATAQGGGKLVNKDLFDGPTEMEEFRKKANDPGFIAFVDGDEMKNAGDITYINSNQYPAQVINQLERMWEIVDRVSKVPAAVEAISENANESGVLFERKLQVARINTITIVNRLKSFRKSLAEAYYNQWQVAYNGPERQLSTGDGQHSAVLNKRVFKDGKIYIQNRPDQIPRCKVICTESKRSPNARIRERALYSDLYNLAVQSNPEYTGFFFKKLLQTMDLDADDQRELSMITEKQAIRDSKRMDTESKSLDAQGKMADFQGLQVEMQMEGLQKPQIPQQEIPEEDLPDNETEESELPSAQEEQEVQMSADTA